MIILLTLIAIVITGVPLAAAVLVTVASRREESARSIAGRAPGRLERAARRLLAFQATGIGRPAGRPRPRPRPRPRGAYDLATDDDLVLASKVAAGDDLATDDDLVLADELAADDDLVLADGA
jgi:hypothetical protein